MPLVLPLSFERTSLKMENNLPAPNILSKQRVIGLFIGANAADDPFPAAPYCAWRLAIVALGVEDNTGGCLIVSADESTVFVGGLIGWWLPQPDGWPR